MAKFCVIIRGDGIEIPDEDPAEPTIVGFYVNVFLPAPDEPSAAAAALRQIEEEWRQGKYAEANRGGAPVLTVERVTKAPWYEKAGRLGYTFFPADEEEITH